MRKAKSLGTDRRPHSAATTGREGGTASGPGRALSRATEPRAQLRAGSRAGRPRPLKAGGDRRAVPTKATATSPPSQGPPRHPGPHALPPRSLLVRADPVPVTDSEILGRHLGRQQQCRPQRRPHRSRGASRRAVRAPPDPPFPGGGEERRPPTASLEQRCGDDAREPAARPEALPRCGLTAFLSRRCEDSPARRPSQ